ncbi:MAG TPA: mucoidy inhibitor MuiA family protein [Opitutaceae bacterium]|nr:mucoidy inhibitor MuiA family protein [Opitutaceae bacterium]
MKIRLLAAFVLTAGSVLAAEPLPVSSQISAVTVYTDRALVTRTAHLDLSAGPAELVFEKLPAALIDESLQVSGRGAADVTILDVDARTSFVAATTDPRLKPIEDEIAAVRKKVRALDDRTAVLEQQRALLGKIESAMTAPPAKDSTAARPSVDDWQKLLSFADDNRNKFAAEQQTLDEQRKDLEAQITALTAQFNNLHGDSDGGRSYKTVIVRVAAASAGSLDLTLAYAVPGASWRPAYDARLHSEERVVELTYFGIVQQATGEDWKNVALTLSTARPSLGGGAPELQPWIVDVAQPQPVVGEETMKLSSFEVASDKALNGRQAFNQAAASGSVGGVPAAPPEEKDAALATATVASTVTSASFKIPVAATILSDNAPQKVGIATARLAARLQYQATPRALEAAFLSAYATNSTDFPLLAGSMNAFLDDSFVATSSLSTVMPGEKFELALGADEGIAIKRKVVNRFTEDTGIVSKGKRITYEFLVTLTNNKKTAQHVVFKDLVPVSRNEKIVVKLITPAKDDLGTPDAPKEVSREADGKLVWRLDLKPGEKREVPLKFSVEYPADLPVEGLE